MDLPAGIAARIGDLEVIGFQKARESDEPWPGGPEIEMRRAGGEGVRSVRMSVDRGAWDVRVEVGQQWYEPYWALRVLDDKPDERRALSHAERRAATVEAVQRIRGDGAERTKLKRRYREAVRAYTRWVEGKGPPP